MSNVGSDSRQGGPVRPRHIPRPVHGRLDPLGIIDSVASRMVYSVGKDEYTVADFDMYQALAFAVRDRLMERWFLTQDAYYRADAKRVYYLSLEFLMGRALGANILSLGADGAYGEALRQIGYDLEQLQEKESDAGLGNGGLGRLAACFLDSAAALAIPFYGYGIRYEFGIFRQHIHDGHQVEAPDNWLRYGNPWELPRPDALFPVRFGGRVINHRDASGYDQYEWVGTETIYAMAYDSPIAGFQNQTVNTLRLWAAKSSREFDLAQFNAGDYVRAVEDKTQTENISKVLYPPDDRYAGKELRLRQQYFFVSATLQDVIRRFKKQANRKWEDFPQRVAIQLNDTHPAIAIPELMRVLIDQERLGWDRSWSITERVFGYTNHTVLPEALETWPLELMGRLLPRHVQIIEEIDRRFRIAVAVHVGGDEGRTERMAIVDRANGRVRMANLAIVGSHSVNGVARLHTDILVRSTFKEFHDFFPGRFNNKTNGITPRRWLLQCNPALAGLITEAIGAGWIRELDELRRLAPLADDSAFRQRWAAVKRANKQALAGWANQTWGVQIDPESLCDCQVKRIHEYKRQLLNVLHVIALYLKIRDGAGDVEPRTVLFAGKAAPSYTIAKLIIKLVHAVGNMISGDPVVSKRLRLVFVPNYGVSAAERIFPACELSEQISTAGTEASGTGNMKAALNGALTIGTLDGANVEICEEVGEENIFIFGHKAEEIAALRAGGDRPGHWIDADPLLRQVIDTIASGPLDRTNPGIFRPIVEILTGDDRYFHCADFGAYVEAQSRAAAVYRDPERWTRMSIHNVAGMGRFSSDRTVLEYANEIWHAQPVPIASEDAQSCAIPPRPAKPGAV